MLFLNDYLLLLISWLILVIFILIGVAFLTLLERKVLDYIQSRNGPSSVSCMGLIQSFSDAIKLFCKEQINSIMSNYFSY